MHTKSYFFCFFLYIWSTNLIYILRKKSNHLLVLLFHDNPTLVSASYRFQVLCSRSETEIFRVFFFFFFKLVFGHQSTNLHWKNLLQTCLVIRYHLIKIVNSMSKIQSKFILLVFVLFQFFQKVFNYTV